MLVAKGLTLNGSIYVTVFKCQNYRKGRTDWREVDKKEMGVAVQEHQKWYLWQWKVLQLSTVMISSTVKLYCCFSRCYFSGKLNKGT